MSLLDPVEPEEKGILQHKTFIAADDLLFVYRTYMIRLIVYSQHGHP